MVLNYLIYLETMKRLDMKLKWTSRVCHYLNIRIETKLKAFGWSGGKIAITDNQQDTSVIITRLLGSILEL